MSIFLSNEDRKLLEEWRRMNTHYPQQIGVVSPLTLSTSPTQQIIGIDVGQFQQQEIEQWFIAEILSSETVDNLGLSDFASSGSIGAAGSTVDIYDRFIFDQDTSGVTVDVPDPTSPVDGQLIYFINRGTNSITVNNGTDDFTVIVNGALTLEWSDDDGQWIENTELVDYDFKAYSWVERIQNSAGVWQNGNKSGTLNAYRAEPSTGAYQTVPNNSVVLMKSSSSIGGEYEFVWSGDENIDCCDTIETELCGRITNVCPIPIWITINDGFIVTSDTEAPGYTMIPGGGGVTVERTGYCGGVITNATWSSGTATFTSASHPLETGDTVTISTIDPSGYNGTFVITDYDASTFDVAIFSDPGTYVSGGIITAPDVIYCEDNPNDCCPPAPTCECGITEGQTVNFNFSGQTGVFSDLPAVASFTMPGGSDPRSVGGNIYSPPGGVGVYWWVTLTEYCGENGFPWYDLQLLTNQDVSWCSASPPFGADVTALGDWTVNSGSGGCNPIQLTLTREDCIGDTFPTDVFSATNPGLSIGTVTLNISLT